MAGEQHGWDVPPGRPRCVAGSRVEEGGERAVRSSGIRRRWSSRVGHQRTTEEPRNLKQTDYGAEVIGSGKWCLWPD